MKIVSTVMPRMNIQEEVKKEFPNINFLFFTKMEEAEKDLEKAEVLITYGEDINEIHIKKANNLKWIMVMSAGLDLMPLKACKDKGILVTNARGVHKIPMAEYTIGTMLQHIKQTKALWLKEEEEIWDQHTMLGELGDKTILILGVGAIGSEIARIAKAFRMKTLGVNRSGSYVDHVDEIFKMNELDLILPKADFIVSVLPSTIETKYLLNMSHFEKMKDTSVFINIGRGDVVKEEVLLKVLEQKMIAHAYLDVFEVEPLPKGHSLWKIENVTVTPHLSSRTKKYLPRSFEIFKHNLHTYIDKRQDYINLIDLKRGY